MAYDPWDWANNPEKKELVIGAPLSNIVTPMAASNERGDPGQVITLPPTQAQKDMQQMRSMAVNKGAEKGGEYAYGKYKELSAPTQAPLAEPTYTWGAAPATTAGTEVAVTQSAPLMATNSAAASGIPMAAGSMAPEAVALGTEAALASAPATAVAAPLATTAATTAGTAAAGATEAGMLASMGPIGWGVGALMLAKSMDWI